MRAVIAFLGLLLVLSGAPAVAIPGDAQLYKQVTTRLAFPAEIVAVERSVDLGLVERGWAIEQKEPGRTVASILVRGKHFAQIAVTYDTTSFTINLLRSEGLDQNDRRGVIHPVYVRWTRNLIVSINRKLVSVAGPPPSVYAPQPVTTPQVAPAPPAAPEPEPAPEPALPATTP